MIARLRTFLVVALITILIWIVAESSSLRSETLSATVISASTPDYAVSIIAPTNFESRGAVGGGGGEISVLVDGATSRLDAVAASLRTVLRLEPGSLGVPREAGEHVIDLRTFVQSSPALVESGVRVSSVQPPTVTLRVEPIVTRAVPIRAVLPELDLEGSAEVTPTQATLHLPESMAQTLAPDAAAIAEVDSAGLRGVRAGQPHVARGVVVRPPPALAGKPFVSLEVTKADVAFTVRSSVMRRIAPEVPVMLRCDPALLTEWDVQIEPRIIREVGVVGPPSAVTELTPRAEPGAPIRTPLVAFITLTREELERADANGGTLIKDAVFSDLPSSLSFDAKDRAVRLKVQRRSPGTQ